MSGEALFIDNIKEKIVPLTVGETVLYYPDGWGSFRDPYNDFDVLQGRSIEVEILHINWSYRIAAVGRRVKVPDGFIGSDLEFYAVPTGQLRRPCAEF